MSQHWQAEWGLPHIWSLLEPAPHSCLHVTHQAMAHWEYCKLEGRGAGRGAMLILMELPFPCAMLMCTQHCVTR